ncbi:Lrp/AsnC family transcriptional regulator [Actinomycetospora rhizophila]|uniref:Lrp/AsnC family transcriptional regulator n=1 Tax=Actinomycetospora rhizophila TaxID=1416876 RepID=A0ABV9ZI03_9PSEU
MELPPVDRTILVALQQNSRITNRELASRVGLAESTTHERVRRLVDAGVVTRFTADLDPGALGRPMQALIAVQLRPQSAEVVTRFLDAVVGDPCVLDATVLSGETDVQIRVAVASSEALRRFAWQKVTSVPSVRSIQTHIVYEHRRGPGLAETGD